MSSTLLTVTWSYEPSFNIEATTLYRSFKHFNPTTQFKHLHFNRGHFWKQEAEFVQKFGPESEYILYKIVLLKDALAQLDTDYVIFCDANDVVCLNNVDYLLQKFDLTNRVIVGAEKNQWPPKETKETWKQFGFEDYSGFDAENNFYLNSGMILASKVNFEAMLQNMIDQILTKGVKNFRNDQGVYTWYYTSKLEPKIELDYQNVFVVNTFSRSVDEFELIDKKLRSKANENFPCFVHDNGWNHGSPKYVNAFQLRQAYSEKFLHLKHLASMELLPETHKQYLIRLRDVYKFTPNTIYDVGACVMDWARNAKKVWPSADVILFEAMEESAEIFQESGYKYQIGVFSDVDDKELIFYKNTNNPHGNSYYKENPAYSSCAEAFYGSEANQFKRKTLTLDTAQRINNFPLPDLLKIDVQGCEIDILKGSTNILSNVKHLIVELQHVEYNIGAQLCDDSIKFIESLGFRLETPKFSPSSPADADYHFVNEKFYPKLTETNNMNLNILTTGVLCNDPLISNAAEQLNKAEFKKYFEPKWTLVTHSQERANLCNAQAQSFENISVVIDEESRSDRTNSTRKALLNINEGELVWMMPEGFIPTPDCAQKISNLIANNTSIAIEGTKCSGLDHIIFQMPSHPTFKDSETMMAFFDSVRKNGLSVPSEELSSGSVTGSGKIEHGAKSDMERLSVIYWNLKYSFHKYTHVYESLLNKKRFSATSLLEIGVAQGASLRTFRDFFPCAKIFGLDIYPESILKEPRIDVVIGNSSEEKPFLQLKEMNGGKTFDIIVDDGSHNPADQLRSFELLWPMLSENGLYIIEDVTGEEALKNELAKTVARSSIVTFDLRPQSNLVDSGVVLISK